MNKKNLFTLLFALIAGTSWAANDNLKPRLVVCTDIAPADVDSVGWNCDPYPLEWQQYLYRVITAYAKDVPNLMRRSGQKKHLSLKKENGQQELGYWPSAEYITSRAVMGSMYGGIRSIGDRNDSPGSELLIRLADEDDPRPIYVAAWGGANTLAQAIWRVKQSRSADELAKFVRKFRLFTITDQDMKYDMRMDRAYSSHMWLRKEFQHDLQFIWDEGAWQEQCELGKQHWQQHQQNIQGHGALGREYPNYKWGVEGDTPSFLYVMPNGLNNPEDPLQCGWAGYHERGICADSLTTAWTSWKEPVRSISVGYKQRFYPDELNDFCARMQWAAEGRGNLNPYIVFTPQVKFDHPLSLEGAAMAVSNDTITLTVPPSVGKNDVFTIRMDASKSFDPDGDGLSFLWWQQPEIGHTRIAIEASDESIATIRIPAKAIGDTVHLICEVHDNGPFHLVSYRRIIITIK